MYGLGSSPLTPNDALRTYPRTRFRTAQEGFWGPHTAGAPRQRHEHGQAQLQGASGGPSQDLAPASLSAIKSLFSLLSGVGKMTGGSFPCPALVMMYGGTERTWLAPYDSRLPLWDQLSPCLDLFSHHARSLSIVTAVVMRLRL